MSSRKSIVAVAFVASAALLAGTFAIADEKPTNGKDQPEMKAPPGMDPAHMQACMEAMMPGKNHEWLQKMVGTWKGKSQMWMSPEIKEATTSECSEIITSLYDGKFIEATMSGDMGGMPFKGRGTTGFDNVSKKFVSTWIDNCSTGIMNGTGDLSADGKVMTWSYTANCPIAKKAITMKMTETYNSPDSMTFVMYMNDFKTGKEFKHMQIELTRAK